MVVFLCESRHGINVSCCVIMMDGGSVDADAYQNFVCWLPCVGVLFTLERIVFTPHRLQLFPEPSRFSAGPCLMTPDYECTPTHGAIFEYLLMYGV